MGTMPEATAAMVLRETGVNVSGYTAILPGDSVQHIIKRHGDANTENARGQVAVSETDIALIPEVLSAPDSVTLSESTDVQGRSVLLFSKQIGNEYVTAQAVTDGRHALTTNSLWIKKGKDRPAIPNAGKASPVENVQNALPQDPSAAPSIAQPQTEVNPTADAENSGRLTLPTLEDEPAQPTAERAAETNTAPVEGQPTRMRMEEFANKKSPVYTNVAYDDHQTQREITRRVHEQMVQTGSVVQIPDDASEGIREYYPDLRRMKKTERTPILKQKMGELKAALRKILDGLKGTTYQFEINGNILDAKLYDTGIREVLEKITQNKAEMLTQSDAIFRNAQYLYSTPDYEGNSNIYRWNYFYSPV